MDKLRFGLTLLRGDPSNPPLPRESELLQLCNTLAHGQVPDAFPGAQPTSLTRQKIGDHLLQEPYLVCEKTDGERHLLLAHEGRVFLVDRSCRVWLCPVQLPLPHDHPRAPGWHHLTLLDGELVLDDLSIPVANDAKNSSSAKTDKTEAAANAGTSQRLRYLVYDAIRVCGEDLTHRTLLYRLRRAITEVVLPKEQLLEKNKTQEPLHVMVKDFFEIWQLQHVFALAGYVPHRCDGLVFTPVLVPYAPGTCPALLKWKPCEMNTVDFMLKVVAERGKRVHVKLLVGIKKREEWQVHFSGLWLAKTGPAFRALQEDSMAFDGKVGECRWQKSAKTFVPAETGRFTVEGTWENGGWVLQRIREDKTQPNDMRTAKRVVESIEDDLSLEDLDSQVTAAYEDGTLKVALECGEGELPRADACTALVVHKGQGDNYGKDSSWRQVNWGRPVGPDENRQGNGDGRGHERKPRRGKGRGRPKDQGDDAHGEARGDDWHSGHWQRSANWNDEGGGQAKGDNNGWQRNNKGWQENSGSWYTKHHSGKRKDVSGWWSKKRWRDSNWSGADWRGKKSSQEDVDANMVRWSSELSSSEQPLDAICDRDDRHDDRLDDRCNGRLDDRPDDMLDDRLDDRPQHRGGDSDREESLSMDEDSSGEPDEESAAIGTLMKQLKAQEGQTIANSTSKDYADDGEPEMPGAMLQSRHGDMSNPLNGGFGLGRPDSEENRPVELKPSVQLLKRKRRTPGGDLGLDHRPASFIPDEFRRADSAGSSEEELFGEL